MSNHSILNVDEKTTLEILEEFPLEQKIRILESSINASPYEYEKNLYRSLVLKLQKPKADAEVRL